MAESSDEDPKSAPRAPSKSILLLTTLLILLFIMKSLDESECLKSLAVCGRGGSLLTVFVGLLRDGLDRAGFPEGGVGDNEALLKEKYGEFFMISIIRMGNCVKT